VSVLRHPFEGIPSDQDQRIPSKVDFLSPFSKHVFFHNSGFSFIHFLTNTMRLVSLFYGKLFHIYIVAYHFWLREWYFL
jgi:hypothetical protein